MLLTILACTDTETIPLHFDGPVAAAVLAIVVAGNAVAAIGILGNQQARFTQRRSVTPPFPSNRVK